MTPWYAKVDVCENGPMKNQCKMPSNCNGAFSVHNTEERLQDDRSVLLVEESRSGNQWSGSGIIVQPPHSP